MPHADFSRFDPSLFKFLRLLAKNNERDWFGDNKDRYETCVREPSLALIGAFERPLSKLSPHFTAVPKKVGGSLMRVYRDTRFGKNKTPYKTNVGIQFRHEAGRDVHAPGFYFHIEPGNCFLGAGLWRPDSPSLLKIRTAIVEDPTRWRRASRNKRFTQEFTLAGASLKTFPRGFDKEDPLIEDLRRTDFIAVKQISDKDVLSPNLIENIQKTFATARPLMRFLCETLILPF